MSPAEALDIGREAVTVLLTISVPLMLAALIIGLIISLFQALTQIQEMTLTFVPKIITLFVGLIIMMPFMARSLGVFAEQIFSLIRRI